MTVSADTLCQSGIAYPVAIEIARQINAGAAGVNSSSINKLVAIGVAGAAAKELTDQITAQAFDSTKLARVGFHPNAAVTMKKTSGL